MIFLNVRHFTLLLLLSLASMPAKRLDQFLAAQMESVSWARAAATSLFPKKRFW